MSVYKDMYDLFKIAVDREILGEFTNCIVYELKGSYDGEEI